MYDSRTNPSPYFNSYHPFSDLVSFISSTTFFLEYFKANPRQLIVHVQVFHYALLRLRACPLPSAITTMPLSHLRLI